MTTAGRLYLVGEYIAAVDQLLEARGVGAVEPMRYLLRTAAKELQFVAMQVRDAPVPVTSEEPPENALEGDDAKDNPWGEFDVAGD